MKGVLQLLSEFFIRPSDEDGDGAAGRGGDGSSPEDASLQQLQEMGTLTFQCLYMKKTLLHTKVILLVV